MRLILKGLTICILIFPVFLKANCPLVLKPAFTAMQVGPLIEDPIKWKIWSQARSAIDLFLRTQSQDLTTYSETKDDFLIEVFSFQKEGKLNASISLVMKYFLQNEKDFMLSLFVPSEKKSQEQDEYTIEFDPQGSIKFLRKMSSGLLVLTEEIENPLFSSILASLSSENLESYKKNSKIVYTDEASLIGLESVGLSNLKENQQFVLIWDLGKNVIEQILSSLESTVELQVFKETVTSFTLFQKFSLKYYNEQKKIDEIDLFFDAQAYDDSSFFIRFPRVTKEKALESTGFYELHFQFTDSLKLLDVIRSDGVMHKKLELEKIDEFEDALIVQRFIVENQKRVKSLP